MKVRVTSKVSGSEILVDGTIVGRLESFRPDGGCTYVQLRDERGTWAVARFKYRAHRARAVQFTKQLLASRSAAEAIDIMLVTGKTGNALLQPIEGLPPAFARERATQILRERSVLPKTPCVCCH